MITKWAQRNHTVEELFKELHAMKLYDSMALLKDVVPPQWERYLMADTTTDKVQEPLQEMGQNWIPSKSIPPPLPTNVAYQKRDVNLSDNLNEDEETVSDELTSPATLKNIGTDSFHTGESDTQDINCDNQVALGAADTAMKRVDHGGARTAAKSVHQVAPTAAATTGSVRLNNLNDLVSLAGATGATQHTLESSLSSRLRQPSGVPLPTSDVLLNNIDFHKLRESCHNFDRGVPGALLGSGGFGEVFRGTWNGQDVAVKRILEEKRFQVNSEAYQRCIKQAIVELQALATYPAENILPLLGISFDSEFRTDPCLVYQLMPNGSVSDRLKCRGGSGPLSWQQRANIAHGTARGLVHLHANNIIHGDIKSGNILLDKYFEPKIGDFGLARGGPENDEVSFKMVSMVQGTQAYLPEDYIRNRQLAPAVDTFCYGIFLFELVSARSPSFPWHEGKDNCRYREAMLDANVPDKFVDKNAPPSYWSRLLFYIGKDCAQKSRKSRPKMTDVKAALDKLVNQTSSSALALQIYYDEQKEKNQCSNGSPFACASAPPQDKIIIPTVLQESKSSIDNSSSSYCSSSNGSLASEDFDQKSFPNLSNFVSESHRARMSQMEASKKVSVEGVPDLSLLRLDNPSAERMNDRLSAIESATSQVGAFKVL